MADGVADGVVAAERQDEAAAEQPGHLEIERSCYNSASSWCMHAEEAATFISLQVQFGNT
jgi:hypothetical protein